MCMSVGPGKHGLFGGGVDLSATSQPGPSGKDLASWGPAFQYLFHQVADYACVGM